MKAKELAELSGTTVRTIRYYHECGLLPTPTNAGVRDYGIPHAVRLARIRFLRDSGMSIPQIQRLLQDRDVDLTAEIESTAAAIDAQIAELQRQKDQLKQLQAQHHLVPTAVPLPQRVGAFYDALLARCSPNEPEVSKLVQKERRLVELLVHSGALDQLQHYWPVELPESRISNTLSIYRDFANLSSWVVPEPGTAAYSEVIMKLDELVDKHVHHFTSEYALADVQDLLRKGNQVTDFRRLVQIAFPKPAHLLYFDRFLTRYAPESQL